MTAAIGDGRVLPLRGGGAIPVLGFGTWRLRGGEAYDAVRTALDVGYRHVDTATMYQNEQQVGRALRDSGVPREEVFVTTKLPPERAGRERETIKQSLRELGVDRVDLWLVHWPPGGSAAPRTWEQFLAAQQAGLTVDIGVSNYSPAQVDELIDATGVAPAVNQIRWSPALYDEQRLRHSRDRGVVLEGYSPFRASQLDDAVLLEIAEAHGVTAPQVILRWHIDTDVVAIPKSAHPERIRANFAVWDFALTPDEIARINTLGTGATTTT